MSLRPKTNEELLFHPGMGGHTSCFDSYTLELINIHLIRASETVAHRHKKAAHTGCRQSDLVNTFNDRANLPFFAVYTYLSYCY